jgi:muramoyltetrapeptide carboxypeptidase
MKEWSMREVFLIFGREVSIFCYSSHHTHRMQTLKPRRLQHGDLIGLVTPASPIADPARIERGVRYLETLGYRVLVAENVNKSRGYLAGTDEERIADLHALFRNTEVRAIFCIRGGYGTPRILSLIDYRLIARNPKIFVGYSDITALQLAIWKRCRLVTFQGPMLGVDLAGDVDHFAEEWLWKLLTSKTPAGPILSAAEATVTVRPGKARGQLLGGNLALMLSIFGTRYQPDYSGSLLFLEDTDEEPYRIDRMFTQLRHASILSKCAGLLLGQFTDSDPKDPTKPSLTLAEVFGDVASWSSVPILSNLPFGHIPRKLTLPQGIGARVDTQARTLNITESAVR